MEIFHIFHNFWRCFDLNTTNNKTTKRPSLAQNNHLNVKVSVEDKRGEGAPENVHSLKLLAL